MKYFRITRAQNLTHPNNVCLLQATKLSESITAKSVCTECIFPASNACVIDFKAELLRYKSNKSYCKMGSLNSMAICHFSSATHAKSPKILNMNFVWNNCSAVFSYSDISVGVANWHLSPRHTIMLPITNCKSSTGAFNRCEFI